MFFRMWFENARLLAFVQVGLVSAAINFPAGYQAKPGNVVPGAYIVTFEASLVSFFIIFFHCFAQN